MTISIYHNPACSKSRKTLQIIRDHGIEPRIVEYLKEPPDGATILTLADLLQLPVDQILRKNEPDYKEALQDGDLQAGDAAVLAAWVSHHPKALERPIVVDDERRVAVIGRPPESVLGLLSEPAAESSAGS